MKIIIESKDATKRLDKFLSNLSKTEKTFEGFSRGDFARAVKEGKVLVNELQVKPSHKLLPGDEIYLTLEKKGAEIKTNPKVKIEIIFEDRNIIAINKPAGLQIHPDHNEKSFTLLNGIAHLYPEIMKMEDISSGSADFRPGIVHRIDKETSGILIIAKNKKAFDELKRMFKEREIQKKYLAIVYGTPDIESGTIDKPLARTSNYRRQTIAGRKTKTKIREAVTHYKLLEKLKNNLSLIEVSPKTGRTHQIRVHLFSIGIPIVGDKLYKLKVKSEKLKANNNENRHMLHAKEIKFNLFGKDYDFSVEPPADFQSFLKQKVI